MGGGQRGGAAGEARKPGIVARWSPVVIVAAAFWLAAQMLTQGLSDASLATDPERAVRWRGDSNDALLSFAYQQLRAGDNAHAAALARHVIASEPLNAAALSVLGLALDRGGEPQRAETVMQLAGALGWRDELAQIWLLRGNLVQKRYEPAVTRADALLRRDDDFKPVLFKALASLSRAPDAISSLASHLAARPPWREAFLRSLAGLDPPQAAIPLLSAIAQTSAPPSDAEIAPLLSHMADAGQADQALQLWRRLSATAPPPGELLNDGDFEQPAGEGPFDWRLSQGVGWSSEIADEGEAAHGHALSISYDGAAFPKPVRQRVVLAPGAYSLAGQVKSASGSPHPPLAWRIVCDGGPEAMARRAVQVGITGWSRFNLAFTIPSAGCASAWVSLEAVPADQPAPSQVWFDDLAIQPAGGNSPQLARPAGTHGP